MSLHKSQCCNQSLTRLLSNSTEPPARVRGKEAVTVRQMTALKIHITYWWATCYLYLIDWKTSCSYWSHDLNDLISIIIEDLSPSLLVMIIYLFIYSFFIVYQFIYCITAEDEGTPPSSESWSSNWRTSFQVNWRSRGRPRGRPPASWRSRWWEVVCSTASTKVNYLLVELFLQLKYFDSQKRRRLRWHRREAPENICWSGGSSWLAGVTDRVEILWEVTGADYDGNTRNCNFDSW